MAVWRKTGHCPPAFGFLEPAWRAGRNGCKDLPGRSFQNWIRRPISTGTRVMISRWMRPSLRKSPARWWLRHRRRCAGFLDLPVWIIAQRYPGWSMSTARVLVEWSRQNIALRVLKFITAVPYNTEHQAREAQSAGRITSCQDRAHLPSSLLEMNKTNSKPGREDIRHRIVMSSEPRSSSWPPRACPTMSSQPAWTLRARS